MPFHVGQKVVCISNDWYSPANILAVTPNLPRKGGVYQIRRVELNPDAYRSHQHPLYDGSDRVQILWLVELQNPSDIPGGEYGFAHFMFRPVLEKKTDISVFTRLLNPIKTTETV